MDEAVPEVRGHVGEGAGEGEAAFLKAPAEFFDVLLTKQNLPGMDAFSQIHRPRMQGCLIPLVLRCSAADVMKQPDDLPGGVSSILPSDAPVVGIILGIGQAQTRHVHAETGNKRGRTRT